MHKLAFDAAQECTEINAFRGQTQQLLHLLETARGVALSAKDFLRQVFWQNDLCIAHNLTILNHASQLTHVPRPVIAQQEFHSLRAYTQRLHALKAVYLQEVLNEWFDIFGSISQWW